MIGGFLLGLGLTLLLAWVLIPLFRPTSRLRGAGDTSALDSLTESRNAIYRSMLDLDFDRSVGKVSEEDYAVLRSQHESDAARILSDIDELNGSRSPAPRDPLEEEIAAARRRRRE
jgi:hypothetical protein